MRSGFDLRTGIRRWGFHARPGEPPYPSARPGCYNTRGQVSTTPLIIRPILSSTAPFSLRRIYPTAYRHTRRTACPQILHRSSLRRQHSTTSSWAGALLALSLPLGAHLDSILPLVSHSLSSWFLRSLSEDPNVTVGIIEAGEWETDLLNINIPGVFSVDFDVAYAA